MNSRARKRRTYASYRRFGRFWLTAEDRAWLDTLPIGREFGSQDFNGPITATNTCFRAGQFHDLGGRSAAVHGFMVRLISGAIYNLHTGF